MRLPDIGFHECKTLDEAARLLGRYPGARLLAGGTDLLVDLKSGRVAVDHVVSLNRIAELRGIKAVEGGVRIGALTTVAQVGRSSLLRERLPAICDATRQMAVPQIRNIATIGGNLASAVPCADLPPILMVLGARVALWSAGKEREVALDSFFEGVRRTACGATDIVSRVFVPDQARGCGAAYERFSLREGNAIAVASVAAGLRLDDAGIIQDARIVLGAVAPIPKMVPEAAGSLMNRNADEAAFSEAARIAREAAEPISDLRGSADFRRELVEVLTRRALEADGRRAVETCK